MERLTTTPALIRSNKIKGLSNYSQKHHDRDKEISLLTILENYGMKCFFLCFKAAQQDRIAVKKLAVELASNFAKRAIFIFDNLSSEEILLKCLKKSMNWLENPSETTFEIREGAKINPISQAAVEAARYASVLSETETEANTASVMATAYCAWTALSASEIIQGNEALSINLTAMCAYSTALWARKALGVEEEEKQIKIIQDVLTQ